MDEFKTLVDRRNWLAARIELKRSVGRATQYDEREHNALCWAVESLRRIRDHQCFIDERDDLDLSRRRVELEENDGA